MKEAGFDIERDFEAQVYDASAERVRKVRPQSVRPPAAARGPGELVDKVLYTDADTKKVGMRGVPGHAPYVRGSRQKAPALLCSWHNEPRLEFAAQHIENDIARGTDALALQVGPRRGVRI